MSHSIGIIGGADGPTAIFITGDPSATLLWAGGILLLLVLALFIFKKKK